VRSTVITASSPVRPARQGGETFGSSQLQEDSMASVTKLIKDFARSPRGQQLIEQVKEQASKPENRRKLEELRRRYAKRR
jgi:Zn-dependent M32 family carboxypeptidase